MKMLILELVSFTAIATTTIGILPQMIRTYKTKSVKDISMFAMVNMMLCSISWLIYGILINDVTVWSPNVLAVVSCVSMVYFKFAYK